MGDPVWHRGDWVLDNAGRITDVVQAETAKPRAEASLEAPVRADLLNYWARNAGDFLADRHPRPAQPPKVGLCEAGAQGGGVGGQLT